MGTLHKLTATQVKGALAPGRHSDGGGLYLNVTKTDARSWLFMFKRSGRRREIGLGSLQAVTLKEARNRAEASRAAVARGDDPAALFRPVASRTFREAADAYLAAKDFRHLHDLTRHQWERSLMVDLASLHSRPVAELDGPELAKALRPHWKRIPESARRTRNRAEKVLDHAKAMGWREGENPARWKGNLDALLTAPSRGVRSHHAAMPWRDLPAFMGELRKRPAMSARALEFTILTAARTGEAVGARWDELDLDAALWTLPAERMKVREEHTVPLSEGAVRLLWPLWEARVGPYVFPGHKAGRPLSNMAMLTLLKKRMGHSGYTVHGFRSSFRDWAGDGEPGYPRELAERALAHTIGGSEGSYRRARAVERRRPMMQAWDAFCSGQGLGNSIVRLHAS